MDKQSLNLTDEQGQLISEDDVLAGKETYWRIYKRKADNTIEMISCTNGYMHDITQDKLKGFKKIGTFEEHQKLFECD